MNYGSQVFNTIDDFIRFLDNPRISQQVKDNIIQQVKRRATDIFEKRQGIITS